MSGLFHWILYGLGTFYCVLATIIAYRASKPSCRVCRYWQTCLPALVGLNGVPPERCTTPSAKLD